MAFFDIIHDPTTDIAVDLFTSGYPLDHLHTNTQCTTITAADIIDTHSIDNNDLSIDDYRKYGRILTRRMNAYAAREQYVFLHEQFDILDRRHHTHTLVLALGTHSDRTHSDRTDSDSTDSGSTDFDSASSVSASSVSASSVSASSVSASSVSASSVSDGNNPTNDPAVTMIEPIIGQDTLSALYAFYHGHVAVDTQTLTHNAMKLLHDPYTDAAYVDINDVADRGFLRITTLATHRVLNPREIINLQVLRTYAPPATYTP